MGGSPGSSRAAAGFAGDSDAAALGASSTAMVTAETDLRRYGLGGPPTGTRVRSKRLPVVHRARWITASLLRGDSSDKRREARDGFRIVTLPSPKL